ncbi:MAG: hypothetical protein FWE35_10890 [Streptosporangiales bacterium]|nr:hypothetical protein [Streptosporangiales bacterium]
MSVCYHGRRDRGNPEIIIHCPQIRYRAPLPHLRSHARTLDWGDGGPGADDLARSLLISAAGRAALCPACRGTGRLVWDLDGDEPPRPFHPAAAAANPDAVGRCLACIDGYTPSLPYQLFKIEIIRDLGTWWRISRAEILEWLAEQQAEGLT